MLEINLRYCDALALFSQLDKSEDCSFLYSALQKSYSGKYSVLSLFPIEEIKTDLFSDLEKKASKKEKTNSYFSDGYFGYISYDIKNEFEELPQEENTYLSLPKILLRRYALNLFFNHEEKSLKAFALNKEYMDAFKSLDLKEKKKSTIEIKSVDSNFTKAAYLSAVRRIKDYIYEGDIFEANVSQKFMGEFEEKVDGKILFSELMKLSPSHYAAYMKMGDLEIISSSPERFLKCKNSVISSKPIKGTRPRGKNLEEDALIKKDLENSEKDRAENLMIVDLVRNDIGKVAETASVKVDQLFEIESYETVHQMLSSISGKLRSDLSIFDLLRSAFPPGSMTGAPKIRAMEIITELESYTRGIYSGCLGYFGLDHYLDLSVVIRTLVIQNKKFEFQVGGAIVSDSDPEMEYQESLDKAAAIMKLLGIREWD